MRDYVTTDGRRITVPCCSPLDDRLFYDERVEIERRELKKAKPRGKNVIAIIPLIDEQKVEDPYVEIARKIWKTKPRFPYQTISEVVRCYFAILPKNAARERMLSGLWREMCRALQVNGYMDRANRMLTREGKVQKGKLGRSWLEGDRKIEPYLDFPPKHRLEWEGDGTEKRLAVSGRKTRKLPKGARAPKAEREMVLNGCKPRRAK